MLLDLLLVPILILPGIVLHGVPQIWQELREMPRDFVRDWKGRHWI